MKSCFNVRRRALPAEPTQVSSVVVTRVSDTILIAPPHYLISFNRQMLSHRHFLCLINPPSSDMTDHAIHEIRTHSDENSRNRTGIARRVVAVALPRAVKRNQILFDGTFRADRERFKTFRRFRPRCTGRRSVREFLFLVKLKNSFFTRLRRRQFNSRQFSPIRKTRVIQSLEFRTIVRVHCTTHTTCSFYNACFTVSLVSVVVVILLFGSFA